jgi:amidohydrolase
MQQLKDIIRQRSQELYPRLVEIRRHLHAHPELSFEEEYTASYVQSVLHGAGIPFESDIAGHGIVATIQGAKPGKTIALRGDMDALPIDEANHVPYRSTKRGVMHACGHDVHTTCVLGAAILLNEIKDQLHGTVKIIFQPGEEKLPGGASLMIDAGVLENPKVQAIFGQHVHPSLEVGKVGFRPGIFMASTDEIYLTVKGKGGHGAMPQDLIDPVLISAHILVALQQVVSRKVTPGLPTVLSFGKVIANGATNVIPSEVHIEGTFRTFDEAWRAEAKKHIVSIAQGVAQSMGGDCEVEIRHGYPYLSNHVELTEHAIDMAKAYLGEDQVIIMEPRMTGEDFAFYTHHTDACFYRLGTGNAAKGITSPVHTATFDIDEDALKIGAGLMAWLAVNAV